MKIIEDEIQHLEIEVLLQEFHNVCKTNLIAIYQGSRS
jgi:hypothetical protein